MISLNQLSGGWRDVVIKIDISHLPVTLRSIILNNQEFASLPRDNHYDKNDDLVCLMLPQEDREKIIKILVGILSKSRIEEYIVVENTMDESEIAILKSGDIEEIGIFMCAHCGTPFQSHEQMTIHQRMHYIF
jgi:hypothetical protein